jgi:hypothetical protein
MAETVASSAMGVRASSGRPLLSPLSAEPKTLARATLRKEEET